MNGLINNIRYFFNRLFKPKYDDNQPWLEYYSKEERSIKFTKMNIYEYLDYNVKEEDRGYVALNYFGNTFNYRSFFKNIDMVARSLKSLGVKEKDIVSICMPNMPEAVYLFYACNKIGAIADMIHPLSSPEQLKIYLSENESKILFLVDFNYDKYKSVIKKSLVKDTVLVSVKESMPRLLSIGYTITHNFHLSILNNYDNGFMSWKKFLSYDNYKGELTSNMKYSDTAVILHSGGTTGTPKGIMLSNYNFNAEMQQDGVNVYDVRPGDKIVTILPIFHGFGLCICLHTALCLRVENILMPEFNIKRFARCMKNDKPHVLLGVPTMWEAMMSSDAMDNVDLSQMKYLISGGDHLSPSNEAKFNDFLHKHGARINVSKGYGMTESVAATCYTFPGTNAPGSIGIPMVGNRLKIVDPNTNKELPLGVEGEIVINGPTVMKGYLNNKKETDKILKRDKNGDLWLHTGDIGYISPEGLVYYTSRLKRMIVVSGFNVYPSQIEAVINDIDGVKQCVVVGIPHKYKMHVPKAFIVLRDDYKNKKNVVLKEIKDACKKKLSVYSQPKEYEFRDSLPKTIMGKVDYKELEKDGE